MEPHETLDGLNQPLVALPLVSIIIVNFNYGRFLWQAVTSVYEQTYPNFECIIVDNASTDESMDILANVEQVYPNTVIIRCSENKGQSSASIVGYAASSGEYVIFLDADDYLLPDCLSTHIFVHLSLRIPVGFTSGDMLQSAEKRLVLGTMTGLSDYIRSGQGQVTDLLRRIDRTNHIWPLASPDQTLQEDVYYIAPRNIQTWNWAPTSGNCFRRDALGLFLVNERLHELRTCTDSYLLRGVSLLCGSVLIDRALAVYRLHGKNAFSKSPQVNGILVYDRDQPSNNDLFGRQLVIDHLIDHASFFASTLASRYQLAQALWQVDRIWPKLRSANPGCPTYLGGRLIEAFSPLARIFGCGFLIGLLLRLRVSPLLILHGWRKYLLSNKEERIPSRSPGTSTLG